MSEVFWSPVTAMHMNLPPGTAVFGVPGSGKSFTLLNMAANCLEQGANLFVLDAKNDMLPLKRLFPKLKITDVNSISPGSLDPFLIFDSMEAAKAISIIEILCGGELTPDQKLAVTPIVGDFINKLENDKKQGVRSTVTMRSLADYLYSNPNKYAQSIGNQMLLAAQSKYGKLVFGDPLRAAKAMKIGRESRIISILGMSLPTSDGKVKADECVNLAIIYIICSLIKDLLTSKTKNGVRVDKRPTVLVLDEVHILMKSEAIAEIIEDFLVLGRSLGVAVVLATQNCTHFPRSISQYISTKICFRMSKGEAEEFFTMFDNTVSGKELDRRDALETITRLSTGYCFFIDSKERNALVHITSNYDQGDITSNPLFAK